MKKLLIGLLFSICGVSHAITYQSVRASTSTALTPTIQSGTMNLSSGTITNLNTTTLNATTTNGVTGTFSGTVTAGSFSPASAIPAGSTQYIQNGTSLQSNSAFNVSTGTVSSGTITSLTVTNLAVSSMTTTLPMSNRKITGLANGTVSTDAAAFGQLGAIQILSVSTMSVTASSSTAATTFVPTLNTITVTPASTSSRFEIYAEGPMYSSSVSGGFCFATIARNGTNLGGSNGLAKMDLGAASDLITSLPVNVFDSPNTVSAVTYDVRIKNGGSAATCAWCQDGNVMCTMKVIEYSK